jgi:hypothetical protein
MHISTADCPKETQVPFGTIHRPSGLMRGPSALCLSNKPKSVRFGKINYIVHANSFNAIITVDIAIITERCDRDIDLAGANSSDQERGSSVFGRIETIVRRWLMDINTTPTTPFNGTQALQLPHSSQRERLHSIHTKSMKILSNCRNCVYRSLVMSASERLKRVWHCDFLVVILVWFS